MSCWQAAVYKLLCSFTLSQRIGIAVITAVIATHSIQLTPFVCLFCTGDIAWAYHTCDKQCEIAARVAATLVEEEACMHMYTVRLRNLHVFLWYCVLGLGLARRKQNADGRTHE